MSKRVRVGVCECVREMGEEEEGDEWRRPTLGLEGAKRSLMTHECVYIIPSFFSFLFFYNLSSLSISYSYLINML